MTRVKSKSRSAAIVQCCIDNDPTVRATGFRKAVLEVLPDARADFIPDAFSIRPDLRIIDLIEAVDTNPISRAKASLIAELWDHADERGWQVMVIGYDSCGGLMFEMPGNVFCGAFLQKFMGDDTGNAIPAAMAVHREILSRPA